MTKEEREALIAWAVDDHEGWFIAWCIIGMLSLIATVVLMLGSLWTASAVVIAGGAVWPFALIALNRAVLGVRSLTSPKMRRERREAREAAEHDEKIRKAELAAQRHAELERSMNL